MTPDDPLRRARLLFDAQVASLDPGRAGRLRAARRDALGRTATQPPSRWWPAGGLVTAALALALVLPERSTLAPEHAREAPSATTVPGDARSLAATAALVDESSAELEEDADFYAWLAEAPVDDAADLNSLTEGTLL